MVISTIISAVTIMAAVTIIAVTAAVMVAAVAMAVRAAVTVKTYALIAREMLVLAPHPVFPVSLPVFRVVAAVAWAARATAA
jgi:hypothetical protein